MEIDRGLLQAELGGVRNLPWSTSDFALALPLRVLDGLSVKALVEHPLLPVLVKALPVTELLLCLKETGLQDSIEVIESIRGEQLRSLLDFEWWVSPVSEGGASAVIAPHKVLEWIAIWQEISQDFASDRFMELEEEVMVLAMTSICEILPAHHFKDDEAVPEDYWRTGDGYFFLKIISSDPSAYEIIQQLLDGLYKKNVEFTQAFLSHCALLSMNEYQDLGERWRRNRLEDLGFSDQASSFSLLKPLSQKEIINIFSTDPQHFLPFYGHLFSDNDQLKAEIITAFSEMDSDESFSQIVKILGESELKEILGLNTDSILQSSHVLGDQDVLHVAAEKVMNEVLSAFAKGIADSKRSNVYLTDSCAAADQKASLLLEECLKEIESEDFEKSVVIRQGILALVNRVSCGFSSKIYDLDSLKRSAEIVAGALCLGLSAPGRFHKVSFDEPEDEDSGDSERKHLRAAVHLLNSVPPSILFQAGWLPVTQLSLLVLKRFLALKKRFSFLQGISDSFQVSLQDGVTVEISIVELFEKSRFVEVRKWLSGHEPFLEPKMMFFLNTLINRVPLFPKFLSQNKEEKMSTSLVAFSDKKQVMAVVDFISRFDSILETDVLLV